MAEDDGVAAASGKKWLLIAVAAVVFAAVVAGATWFLMTGAGPEAETDAAEVAQTATQNPVQYVELSPAFIVNFPHQGRQRFLQATITAMGRDAAALNAVVEHMPVIRHNLINLLSAQLILVFEDPDGIERVRELATEEVKQILLREIGREGIDQLLFTSFVMQ